MGLVPLGAQNLSTLNDKTQNLDANGDITGALGADITITKDVPAIFLNATGTGAKVMYQKDGVNKCNTSYNVANDAFWITDVDGAAVQMKMNMSDGKFTVFGSVATGSPIDFEDGILYAGAAVNAVNGLYLLDSIGALPLTVSMSNDTQQTSISLTMVKLKETVLTSGFTNGLLTISFDMDGGVGSFSRSGQIYRNGVAVGTLRTSTALDYETYTEQISGWSDGDLLQIYGKTTDAGSTVKIRNLRVTAKDAEFTNQDP